MQLPILNNTVRVLMTWLLLLATTIPVSASPIIFDQGHQVGISETYTYDEIESSVWTEGDHNGEMNWVLSKDDVRSESESVLLNERNAAKGVTNTVTRSESVLGHIFRNAPGHVNPSTVTSQSRYINLFEKVANNSANLNPNVLTNFQRTAGGFQGFSQTFRNGSQVWTQTLNGKIINAGVNAIPK